MTDDLPIKLAADRPLRPRSLEFDGLGFLEDAMQMVRQEIPVQRTDPLNKRGLRVHIKGLAAPVESGKCVASLVVLVSAEIGFRADSSIRNRSRIEKNGIVENVDIRGWD